MDQYEEVKDDRPAPFDVVAIEDVDAPGQDEEDQSQPIALANLGARLDALYTEYKDARAYIEDEWLKDLRQYNGQYEPEVLAKLADNRSKVFVGLTRTKVMAAYSRIVDLLFQRGERWFAVEPTPVAEINPVREAEIKRKAISEVMAQSGGTPYPDLIAERARELRREIQKTIQTDASLAAAEMTVEIEDQIVEANGEQHLKETIMEQVIFGSGCFKAGGTRIDRRKRYAETEQGFALIYEEVPKPDLESVSIFDCFPDPYAVSMDDCDSFFRRHRLTRKQFRDLRGLPGFKAEVIDRIIRENHKGTYTESDVERQRREMSGFTTTVGREQRFEVLEYWGSLSGTDLIEVGVGMNEEDWEALDAEEQERREEEGMSLVLEEDAEYAANVWLAEGEVLMARISPIADGRIPYHIAPYERVPHQFWGVGVPRMMRDSQTTMNSAIRIFLDNQAISSGPMVEVNTDLLEAGEDPQDIHPWRVFLRDGGDPAAPAVRFYQANTNTSGLGNIIEMFRRFADETTSLPSYTHGQQTDALNDTATGASMLMTAANIALKSTIKNVDDFLLEPIISALYTWNMEWSDKEHIKGDFRARARGSTALVQKELQSQRLLQFAQIAASVPPMQGMIDWRSIIEDMARSMDIDPDRAVMSQEAVDAALAQSGGGEGGPVPQGGMPGAVAVPAAALPRSA